MIRVNGIEINVEHFPDGTQRLVGINKRDNWEDGYDIVWQYSNDEELFTLYCLVKHIRNVFDAKAKIKLHMCYIPNARMDRTHKEDEVFTLKYFAEFINSLNFDEVSVMDAHSNVSLGLLNNVRQININGILDNVITDIFYSNEDVTAENICFYFPDDGAMKLYKDNTVCNGRKLFYGKKTRDWDTGKIIGLEIFNEHGEKIKDVSGKSFLMIDDIVSYGGTLAYSADELKQCGANKVFAYVSHTENSVLDKERGTLLARLNNGTVNRLFTTNSLYTGDREQNMIANITVYDILN